MISASGAFFEIADDGSALPSGGGGMGVPGLLVIGVIGGGFGILRILGT